MQLSLETDPLDPADSPKPNLIAGIHNIRSGSVISATLSLLNTGLTDVYIAQAVMIAPDDTITVQKKIVGGSGRVPATEQVVVGSYIQLGVPLPDPWLQPGHAYPEISGYYNGGVDRTYTFTADCLCQSRRMPGEQW